MKPIFVLLCGLLSLGVASASTVTCNAPPNGGVPTNVADNLQISCGGLIFSNFAAFPAGGNPRPEIDLVSALYDAASGMVNLSFNPNMSAPPSGGYQDIHFFFSVQGAIDQIDLSVGGRNATIIETACKSPIPMTGQANEGICAPNQTLATLTAFSAPPGPNSDVSAVFSPSLMTYIYKDLGVSPTYPNGAGGGLTTFSQSFHVAAPVPEPFSLLLTGTGLAGLGLVRRGKKAGRA